jgi:hypothetical protein
MPSLKEIMAEVGLSSAEQTKVASVAKPNATAEIDRVLGELGLDSAESVKTASENVDSSNKNGGSMSSLASIYEQTIGAAPAETKTAAAPATEVAPATPAEKTAAEQEQANDAIGEFGSIVGGYFNEMFGSFVKSAADLETEAGKSEETPLQHAPGGGGMTNVIGKEGDPHLQINHPASSGAALKVTTQGHTPYSLAVEQSVLKRIKGQGIVGSQK